MDNRDISNIKELIASLANNYVFAVHENRLDAWRDMAIATINMIVPEKLK